MRQQIPPRSSFQQHYIAGSIAQLDGLIAASLDNSQQLKDFFEVMESAIRQINVSTNIHAQHFNCMFGKPLTLIDAAWSF